jgi:DNA mismatch endonuclease, patch repair protein
LIAFSSRLAGNQQTRSAVADVFDKETRSRIMKAVRRAETEPEQRLGAALLALGLRFRRNDTKFRGTPDFTFRQARLAVFVDGDFWHGRAWHARGLAPSSNTAFWIAKFERNRRRDVEVDRELRRCGWSVLRLWASDVRVNAAQTARRVRARLRRLQRDDRRPQAKTNRSTVHRRKTQKRR